MCSSAHIYHASYVHVEVILPENKNTRRKNENKGYIEFQWNKRTNGTLSSFDTNIHAHNRRIKAKYSRSQQKKKNEKRNREIKWTEDRTNNTKATMITSFRS